jgi:hypothetical protein
MSNVLLGRRCIVKTRRPQDDECCVLMFKDTFTLHHVTCDVTCAISESRIVPKTTKDVFISWFSVRTVKRGQCKSGTITRTCSEKDFLCTGLNFRKGWPKGCSFSSLSFFEISQ